MVLNGGVLSTHHDRPYFEGDWRRKGGGAGGGVGGHWIVCSHSFLCLCAGRLLPEASSDEGSWGLDAPEFCSSDLSPEEGRAFLAAVVP